MAQSNTAAVDPSMEEILASIRRIIEEGDSADTIPRTSAAAPAASTQPSLQSYDPAPIGPAANDVLRPRAVESRADMTVVVQRDEHSITRKLRPSLGATDSARIDREEAAAPLSHPKHLADSPADFGLDDFDLDRHEEDDVVSVQAPAKAPLISAKASQRVGASFAELNDALAANRQRSLDEIAEELLRPMLQTWLDSNLPPLVERLVREEIERVVRAG